MNNRHHISTQSKKLTISEMLLPRMLTEPAATDDLTADNVPYSKLSVLVQGQGLSLEG